MKTAVIVLTYNRPQALLAVLRALARQCGPQDEIWIADDGSTAENVQHMRSGLPRFSCGVQHVWHPDVGFTAARSRNLAAVRASADYFIFLDGDCVPHSTWLQQHRALAQTGCFVNGSRVLLGSAMTLRVETGELELSELTPLDWLRARLQGDCNTLKHLLSWPWTLGRYHAKFKWKGIRSCNFGVWRKDFVAVDGFDESFSGWGHEDADLVLRLHNLGVRRKNGFCATEVFHLWHPEHDRAHESGNRARVVERMHNGLIRSQRGLEACTAQSDVSVALLNA